MMAGMLGGCAAEDEPETADPDAGRQTTEVPVTIEIGTEWEIDTDDATRALPPGVGGPNDGSTGETISYGDGWEATAGAEGVTEVRLIAFRRPDQDLAKNPDPNTPFVYDGKNDNRFPIKDKGTGQYTTKDYANGDKTWTGNHKHLTATCVLKKVYGYEYKVIVIAYREEWVDHYPAFTTTSYNGFVGWTNLNVAEGLKYEDLTLNYQSLTGSAIQGIYNKDYNISGISNNKFYHMDDDHVDRDKYFTGHITSMPQLFMGKVYWGDNEENEENLIIKYSVNDANGEPNTNQPLHGICRRGTALVEVVLQDIEHSGYEFNRLSLIATNVNTTVNLSDYSNFDHPTKPIAGETTKYSVVDHVEFKEIKEPLEKGIDIRKQTDGYHMYAWVLPGKMRLGLYASYKSGLFNTTYQSAGGVHAADVSNPYTATGVISPVVHDNVFYFKKNHKYLLRYPEGTTGDLYKILTSSLN